ncbi:hypothetical protein V1L54_28360 [Streptomyces sp. TRM 70361]|uniref:hypothetical protein n=1 Tax=Streptomyces sp. TRM 70361 TaxID=3116553 RepID=UPI002E7ADE74|nr:hypothetical protein [Streptomyces sp. TRM 70361]MEE1943272.1 hypothetical protein [Streptomyces sp. TRM 70361]
MLEEVLQQEAAELRRQLADHDPDAFMQRLAARIAESVNQEPEKLDADPPVRSTAARAGRAPTPVRPLTRRCRRRRSIPPRTDDTTATPATVLAEVQRLCDLVLRSNEVDRLVDFVTDYDQAGARTFACLLYTLNRCESALYWWRFAAGAGDELAAHLLATHHAAVGYHPDARLWRTITRMMGFNPDRHLPQPIRRATEIAEDFAHNATRGSTLHRFLHTDHLPRELVAR